MDEDLKQLFGKIMEENKQRILRICSVYAGNREDQKDLYQEVALNIWKSLPSFHGGAMLNTWVYRICLNVCMQYSITLRKNKSSNTGLEGIKILDDGSDPQNNLEFAEKKKQMYQCISKLNDAQKSLILLFLEDLSYKSISDILGITENHVAVKLARIKKKLFNCIND